MSFPASLESAAESGTGGAGLPAIVTQTFLCVSHRQPDSTKSFALSLTPNALHREKSKQIYASKRRYPPEIINALTRLRLTRLALPAVKSMNAIGFCALAGAQKKI